MRGMLVAGSLLLEDVHLQALLLPFLEKNRLRCFLPIPTDGGKGRTGLGEGPAGCLNLGWNSDYCNGIGLNE
jgi:hypothetical protein